MGSLLSTLKAKRNRKSKRKSQSDSSQPQTFPHSASQALTHEHLSSVPPPQPSQQVKDAERHEQQVQEAEIAGGEVQVQKEVQTAAPVPILGAVTSATTNLNTSLPHIKDNKEDKGDMASDEDYASFLDKANEDPAAGSVKSKNENKKVQLKAVDTDVDVPKVLESATKEAYYVSDADEPFEVVALRFGGEGLPDEAGFAKLVNHPSPDKAEVEIMDVAEWDPQGQYKEVVDATREACKGSDVRVYKVKGEGARVWYWVVGVEGGRVVGVKALAVES